VNRIFSLRIQRSIRVSPPIIGLVGEFVLFSASTVVYQLSRLAVSLIVARWVGPEEFGIWNALNLILLYGVVVALGVPNGMNRDVPLLMGQGDQFAAQRIVNSSFWFVLLINTAVGLFISLIGLILNQPLRYPFLAMGVLFLTWQVYQYFQLRLKCYIRFRLMSLQQFIFAVLLPVFALPMAYEWGIPGFIVGQAIGALAVCLLIVFQDPLKIIYSWDRCALRNLVETGFPIMVAGLLYSLLTSVDRWVIVNFLGVEALGHYTLAILCLGVLSLLPAVVSQQMYPRMAFKFGQTRNKRALLPLIIRQSLMSTVVTVPILVLVYAILPFLVDRYIPEYRLGIEPARILLVGLGFIPLAGGVENLLNTVGKQGYYLAVQAGAIFINLCLDILFVKLGWGLNGVALGAAISYALYAIILIVVGLWVMRMDG
jgi:O-antigen/teichoic acid export membrane protein